MYVRFAQQFAMITLWRTLTKPLTVQIPEFVTKNFIDYGLITASGIATWARLVNGDDVKISGFGNFQIRTKAARPGRNPRTGEATKIDARRVVTGALEVQRTAKVIGSSLEAAPEVFVTPVLAKLLGSVNFAELCITSGLVLREGPAPEGAFSLPDVADVAVVFHPAQGEKCQRCWQILPDVGTHKHPHTCARCNAAKSAGPQAAASVAVATPV